MCVYVWMYIDLPVWKCACVGDRGQPRGYYYAPHVVYGNRTQVSMLIKHAFYWLSYLPSPSINLLISPTTWSSKGRTTLFINLHLKDPQCLLVPTQILAQSRYQVTVVCWLIDLFIGKYYKYNLAFTTCQFHLQYKKASLCIFTGILQTGTVIVLELVWNQLRCQYLREPRAFCDEIIDAVTTGVAMLLWHFLLDWQMLVNSQ